MPAFFQVVVGRGRDTPDKPLRIHRSRWLRAAVLMATRTSLEFDDRAGNLIRREGLQAAMSMNTNCQHLALLRYFILSYIFKFSIDDFLITKR